MKIARLFILGLLISLPTSSFGTTHTSTSFQVEISGNGQPVLYLPGFTVPGSFWQETIDQLQLNRKSYHFTYAGFNGTAPIPMPWYDTVKQDLIQYIETEKLTDIILIGHSMGGNLALDIATALPERIEKMVIVDSLPCMRAVMMPNVAAENLFYESPYNQQLLNMEATSFEKYAQGIAGNMVNALDKKEVLTQWILKADRKTFVYGYTDLLKLDQREQLNKINTPTLVLAASFPSADTSKKVMEEQFLGLAKKQIAIATNSRHFIMYDQPQWYIEQISLFLTNGR
jgi:pimeloyl-ACP methyl ester carboxylesterase